MQQPGEADRLRLPRRARDDRRRPRRSSTRSTATRRGSPISSGCSAGGRQGLKAAQTLPRRLRRHRRRRAGAEHDRARGLRRLDRAGTCTRTKASYIPPAKYPAIHDAVLEACDALDGVKDDVHREPARVHVRPEGDRVQGRRRRRLVPDAGRRSTPARTMYQPVDEPAHRSKLIFPGLEYGSELGWSTFGGAAAVRRSPRRCSSRWSSRTRRGTTRR